MRFGFTAASLALLGLGLIADQSMAAPPKAEPQFSIVVAEGEKFQTQDPGKGWRPIHQQDSYASHTYGGMWSSQGGLLMAPKTSAGSVATQTVQIPAAGQYRVWSKYQAPPYFNYLHKIEVVQNGKPVYSHTYGKKGTERLWSFSGQSDELFWFWGVDHDAAEAPKTMANLAAGPAEIRLTSVAAVEPAADVCIDFVVLTTNPADSYKGFNPYQVGSPFTFEALERTKLFVRFQNTTGKPAQLTLTRPIGHFQPNYGGAEKKFPETPVAAGQWSPWIDFGPFTLLVYNDGFKMTLEGAGEFPVQIARDGAGEDVCGDMKVKNGDLMNIPVDVTWNKKSRVITTREHAAKIIDACKTKWRTANGGKKPEHLLYFGGFSGKDPWVAALKDALGYNTDIPGNYPQSHWHGFHGHTPDAASIRKFAEGVASKKDQIFLSFGDEIGLPPINFNDPKNLAEFRQWLVQKGVTADELGMPPAQAPLVQSGAARPMWYSNLFNEEKIFSQFRANSEVARQVFGPQVLTGANYSPHHLALCYGPIYQWVDLFKHNGMSMFWGEDYIFSVPEAPQIFSWMLSQVRCGVKYNNQPIHFYIMGHAPGQEANFLRKNLLMLIGYGGQHIDGFTVAPEENHTENYVAWGYDNTFKAIHESFYDSAEAEKLHTGAKFRPGRVAIVLSKATDFNEGRLKLPKSTDPLIGTCRNAEAQINQIICRKDQQMLFLALKHAQQGVELITEDDIVDGILKNFDAVYFAGEWIDHRTVPVLDKWVQDGGHLYATAGLGHLNEFNEPDPSLQKLLGLKNSTMEKNAVIIRTLLELPLLPTIDTLTLDGDKIPCIGMKQRLTPDSAKVLGTWSDGSAAVTVREHGKGKAFAVGTLAGNTYMKSGVRVQPWPRGGRKNVYNPEGFSRGATKLVQLGIAGKSIERPIVCSNPLVEGLVLDGPQGTLVTLVNWTNGPVKDLEVKLKMPAAPKSAKSVEGQKAVETKFANGELTFTIDLNDADYILLPR